jgi:hypothetical protein
MHDRGWQDGDAGGPQPVDVIYICGLGRSGSTILDRLIGQQAGFVSVGELSKFWSHVVIAPQRCGCGEQFPDCPFWRKVQEISPELFDRGRAGAFFALHETHLRSRSMPRWWLPRGRVRATNAVPPHYFSFLSHLYSTCSAAAGGATIVDSSKNPVYALLLARAPGIRLMLVHLVRDPRAVAFSWTRRRLDPGSLVPRYMFQRGPGRVGAFWSIWNVMCEVAGRAEGLSRMVVRYEDLVCDPEAVRRQVMHFAGYPVISTPSVGSTVYLGVDHTVSGNPARFDVGEIEIEIDDEWRHAQNRRDGRIVTALTAPVLHRYGYELDPGRGSAASAHLARLGR